MHVGNSNFLSMDFNGFIIYLLEDLDMSCMYIYYVDASIDCHKTSGVGRKYFVRLKTHKKKYFKIVFKMTIYIPCLWTRYVGHIKNIKHQRIELVYTVCHD